MIQQIQDTNTNIQVNGFRFPDGTIFKSFVYFGLSNPDSVTASFVWFVDNGEEPVAGLNLPSQFTFPMRDMVGTPQLDENGEPVLDENDQPIMLGVGNLIYTFPPVVIENDPYNTSLRNLSKMLQIYLQTNYANLYNCEIIDIP